MSLIDLVNKINAATQQKPNLYGDKRVTSAHVSGLYGRVVKIIHNDKSKISDEIVELLHMLRESLPSIQEQLRELENKK